jgi:hypothetical protein
MVLIFQVIVPAASYHMNDMTRKTVASSSALHLFNFFNSDKSKATTSNAPVAKIDTTRVNDLKGKLEKISNTQKRDYNAEALANAPNVRIADKQVSSYNYNKPNEFPNLFKGWLKKGGDQIAKQMISSAKESIKKGERLIEILFDPVTNLDEVAFGTIWNKMLREEVVANLQGQSYF